MKEKLEELQRQVEQLKQKIEASKGIPDKEHSVKVEVLDWISEATEILEEDFQIIISIEELLEELKPRYEFYRENELEFYKFTVDYIEKEIKRLLYRFNYIKLVLTKRSGKDILEKQVKKEEFNKLTVQNFKNILNKIEENTSLLPEIDKAVKDESLIDDLPFWFKIPCKVFKKILKIKAENERLFWEILIALILLAIFLIEYFPYLVSLKEMFFNLIKSLTKKLQVTL